MGAYILTFSTSSCRKVESSFYKPRPGPDQTLPNGQGQWRFSLSPRGQLAREEPSASGCPGDPDPVWAGSAPPPSGRGDSTAPRPLLSTRSPQGHWTKGEVPASRPGALAALPKGVYTATPSQDFGRRTEAAPNANAPPLSSGKQPRSGSTLRGYLGAAFAKAKTRPRTNSS